MTEAPKKIWVDDKWEAHPRGPLIATDDITPYVREDIVFGLVEALEMCVKHLDADGNLWSKEEQAMALAALKALEEE